MKEENSEKWFQNRSKESFQKKKNMNVIRPGEITLQKEMIRKQC